MTARLKWTNVVTEDQGSDQEWLVQEPPWINEMKYNCIESSSPNRLTKTQFIKASIYYVTAQRIVEVMMG